MKGLLAALVALDLYVAWLVTQSVRVVIGLPSDVESHVAWTGLAVTTAVLALLLVATWSVHRRLRNRASEEARQRGALNSALDDLRSGWAGWWRWCRDQVRVQNRVARLEIGTRPDASARGQHVVRPHEPASCVQKRDVVSLRRA